PEQGSWVVLDLNSQNGIWIEGQRIQRQVLRPGQIAQLGNFRIVIDTGAGVPATPAAATPAEMPATMVMSRDAAVPAAGGSAAVASSQGPSLVQASPGASAGGAAPHPPPSPTQPAAPARRPKLTPTDGGDQKKGIASIPGPIFYGGSLIFLLVIIGVMYVMKPRPTASASDEPQPPQAPR